MKRRKIAGQPSAGVRRSPRGLASATVVAVLAFLPGVVAPALAGGDPVTFPNDPVIGDLPAHGTVTIEFQVTVDQPLSVPATEVCNQATVSGSNFADVVTDDPETPAPDDSTCTGLQPFDFGDAPDPTYPTLIASDGARHKIDGVLFLGADVDEEADGQADATATGDDTDGNDDEDGVVFTSPLVPTATATLDVTASAAGLLDAWVDWNADGDWDDAGEQVFTDQALAAGVNMLMLPVPGTAASGTLTFARFRFSSAGATLPTGEAEDGEVEDYQVMIEQASISAIKSASPTTVPEPDGPVTFTVRIDNTGTVAVDLTTLSDDVHGDLDGQGDCALPQAIAVSGFYECSFTATADCGNAGGTEVDTVSAMGTGGGAPVSAAAMATVTCVDAAPSVALTKTSDPTSLPEPGGSVDFTVEIENTSVSTDPVTIDSLTDDVFGDVAMVQGDVMATTCAVPQVINPGATYVCVFTADLTSTAGSAVDVVTASGTDDEGTVVMGSAMATVTVTDVAPSIALTKTPSPSSIVEPGAPVAFTVEIENTSVSTDPVTIDSLIDDVYGDVTMVQGDVTATDCAVPQVVNPGETYACTFTADVSGNVGSAVDEVTAAGTDDEGTAVSGSAMATVTITDAVPSLLVTKTPSPATVTEPGAPVVFTVEIENTSVSTDPVTVTSLADDVYGDVTMVQGDVTATDCAVPQVINPGASYVCAFTATVSGSAGDEVVDVVTASGTDDEGTAVSADGSATVGVEGTDFGDAPDSYSTLLASGGARHAIPPGVTLFLGAAIDHETDGQPTAGATGDDDAGIDDEDGVDFTSVPSPGSTATVDVTASAAGLLDAWIDFDENGVFTDAGEQVFASEPLAAGVNSLSYAVPAGPAFGAALVARFRLSSAGGLSEGGAAADGEVEDHLVPIDSVPPQVLAIEVNGDPLEECETLNNQTVAAIDVTFDESVVGLDDPANYLLVTPGGDFAFDTTGCTGPAGDDMAVAIDSIVDADPTATLGFAGGLADGLYRLFVCDTITDQAGNALDGDGDSNAGGDFERNFRVDAANLFENGHFDCDLDPWTGSSPQVLFSTEDADGSSESGSALMLDLSSSDLTLEQCVPIAPGLFQANPYQLDGRVRVDAVPMTPQDPVGLGALCVFFSAAGCGGASLGSASIPDQVLADTGGTWLPFDGALQAPSGALSARCSFELMTLAGGSPDAYLDQLTLSGTGALFADGFESGDTSEWSSVMP